MSIANQIQRIKTNITNAYNEIEKFNVNVSEYNNKSDKLAEAISNITVGETINNQNKTITENGTYFADEGYTGLGEVVVNVANTIPPAVATDDVCRKNLCYWMDAIDNSGDFDTEYKHYDTGINWWSKCGLRYFQGTNSIVWDSDSATFNSSYHGAKEMSEYISAFAPYLEKEVTYEITYSVNAYTTTTEAHIIGNNYGNGGSRIVMGNNPYMAMTCFVNGVYKEVYDPITQVLPLNTKVYLCGRIKQGIMSLYSTQGGVINSIEFTEALNNLFTAPITVGYQGNNTGAYSANQSNINVSSFRVYNRYITDEEMLANCKYEVNRFNIPEFRILTINSNVDGATVTLTADGYTQTDNYIKVLEGTEVTYSVSADGYTTQTGTITLNDTQTIDIFLIADDEWGGKPPLE